MLSASVTSSPLSLHLPGRARGPEQIETGNASNRALASLGEYEMVQGDRSLQFDLIEEILYVVMQIFIFL